MNKRSVSEILKNFYANDSFVIDDQLYDRVVEFNDGVDLSNEDLARQYLIANRAKPLEEVVYDKLINNFSKHDVNLPPIDYFKQHYGLIDNDLIGKGPEQLDKIYGKYLVPIALSQKFNNESELANLLEQNNVNGLSSYDKFSKLVELNDLYNKGLSPIYGDLVNVKFLKEAFDEYFSDEQFKIYANAKGLSINNWRENFFKPLLERNADKESFNDVFDIFELSLNEGRIGDVVKEGNLNDFKNEIYFYLNLVRNPLSEEVFSSMPQYFKNMPGYRESFARVNNQVAVNGYDPAIIDSQFMDEWKNSLPSEFQFFSNRLGDKLDYYLKHYSRSQILNKLKYGRFRPGRGSSRKYYAEYVSFLNNGGLEKAEEFLDYLGA